MRLSPLHIAASRRRAGRRTLFSVLVSRLALLILCVTQPAAAQGEGALPLQSQLQVGVGAIPGIGLEGGYVSPRSFFTVESILYVDASPPFAGGEGNLQLSLGLGGAIRTFSIARTLGNPSTYARADFDVGLRFGPALFFSTQETRADKNQRFRLFLEPYVRFATRLQGGRVIFVSAGTQRPLLRAGFLFNL